MMAYQSLTRRWLDCPYCGYTDLTDEQPETKEAFALDTDDAFKDHENGVYWWPADCSPSLTFTAWQCPDCEAWFDDSDEPMADYLKSWWVCGKCGKESYEEESAVACCTEDD